MDQSHQLLVQGGTFSQRVAVLRLAGEVREAMLKALFVPLESYPISRPLLFLLNAEHRPEMPASFQVFEDPGGVKLQVRLGPFEPEVQPQWERTILAALMTELAIRSPAPRGGIRDEGEEPILSPPRWLMDALLYNCHHPDPLLAPVKLRTVLEGNEIPSLQLLLSRPENDIRASSDAEVDFARCLLWMLSNRPESRVALRELLKIDFSADPLQRLQKIFPSLGNSEAALQREWTLALAAYGTQDEIISLDGTQTQREIDRLLQMELTEVSSGKHFVFLLEQFSDFLRVPGARDVLVSRQLEWIALQERAHFMYAAVIGAYVKICGELVRGKTEGMARRLREVTLERESVSARLSRIRDYVNWYQAVAAPQQNSAKLREFYRILEEKPKVSAAVTRALDRAEIQLREQDEQEDILRVIDEVRMRKKGGN
jgi:hypothetical protein